jgi:hypothetical protein
MVRFTFDANRPMWAGLFMLLAAVAIFIVGSILKIDAIRTTAIAVGILGAVFYLAGRTKQLWYRRY